MPAAFRSSNVSATTFFTLATFTLVFGILYVARSVLLPLAMAVLLTAVLAPLVRAAEKCRIPRVPAVLMVVALVSLGFIGMGVILGNQAVHLSNELGNYSHEIRLKFDSLRDKLRPSPNLQRSLEVLEDLSDATTDATTDATGDVADDIAVAAAPAPTSTSVTVTSTDTKASGPIRVRVVPEPPSAIHGAREWLATIMEPLGLTAMVVVLTVFMLIAREDLRNRLLVLIGGNRVPGSSQLLTEAWLRVSRYLRMQLLINTMYGGAVFALTLTAGLPNAFLFCLQAIALRFIPYLGPLLAAGLPLAVTLAVTKGWSTFIAVGLGLLVLELIVNNVLEPWLYGASTGVSTVGILVSAFFWTWLWGAVGLVLATPLTVCLVVLGRHVPALRFWATLLSEESPLGPVERLYHRLLAGDQFESLHILEAERKQEKSRAVATTCNLLAGAVTCAATDYSIGEIGDELLQVFSQTLDEVWEEVREDLDLATTPSGSNGLRAICLPARGMCDYQVARLAATYLVHDGWEAAAVEPKLLARDVAARAEDGDYDVCVVVAVGERGPTHARYLCRSLGALQDWHGPVVVLIMPGDHLAAPDLERLSTAGAQEVVRTHHELASKARLLAERSRLDRQRQQAPAS